MAYTYSLGLQFASEVFGMWFVIVIALSAVANHVLTPTTGHGMGYLAVAAAFGLAFAFPLTAFGSVSAVLNPAAAIALWTNGSLDAAQFFVISLGDIIGAFFGGLTIYLFYAPQLHKAGAKYFRVGDYGRVMKSPTKDLTDEDGSKGDDKYIVSKTVDDLSLDGGKSTYPPSGLEKLFDKPAELEEQDDPFLGIWVTRPAVWAPLHSFLTEMIATFIFLFLVQTLSARGQYLIPTYGVYGLYSNVILPMMIGTIVGTMVLVMGPTGFAGNPARDLGPRIAHYLLPIPKNKKINSEWRYAWIPVVAPLVGGVISGAIFRGWVTCLKGQVSSDTNPFATLGQSNSTAASTLTPSSPPPPPVTEALIDVISALNSTINGTLNSTTPTSFMPPMPMTG